jgi:hypothetical protein
VVKLGVRRLHGANGPGNLRGQKAFQRLLCHAAQLQEKLAAITQELVTEKDRLNAISAEHFTIAQSLLRTQGDRASRDQRHQLELSTLAEQTELIWD